MSGNTHFVSIEDTSYGGQIANRIGIKIKSMSLFRNVVVVVCILRNGLLLDTTLLKIEGNDYHEWQGDDSYLVQLILNKLGFVKKIFELPDA